MRVNQALAADIVLAVRAVVRPRRRLGRSPKTADAPGAVDWVVEMRRFDEDRTMASAVGRGELRPRRT